MLQQNIPAPPLSDGASTIARLGRAIELLSDPVALQARIDAFRARMHNATDTSAHSQAHTVNFASLSRRSTPGGAEFHTPPTNRG